MANVTRYNAKDCVVTVDGMYITGLGEDMISWAKEEDYFEPKVGAQGDVLVSETNNDIYNLTITVQPTSPQFGRLLSLAKRNDFFPVWVINKALNIRLGGTKAKIKSAPEIALGAAADDVEFGICVFDGITESK